MHVSAAPSRVGLTQALGGRKAFCSFAFQHRDYAGFGQHSSSETLLLRFFFGQVHLARSTITCGQLARFGYCHSLSFCSPAPDAVASETAGVSSRGALGPHRFGFRKRLPGSRVAGILRHLTIRSSRPHVVASATCFCATLARVRRPVTGRLNSGVRQH